MSNFRMTVSEDLLNHFVSSLIEGLDEIQSLRFDLRDGSFFLTIRGRRYVNYSLQAEFEVDDVFYSPDEQTIKFFQRSSTSVRGRFPMGGVLQYLVDEPLKDYLGGFEFVSVNDSVYTFTLRKTETMRSFFDTELIGYKLTELFPFDDLLIHPSEIVFTN